MHKILWSLLFLSALLCGQFKEKEDFDPRQKLLSTPAEGSLFDMNRLSIEQSYTMSYSSSNGRSLANGTYIAGLNYRLADPLNLKLEVGASYTPYTSFTLPSDQRAEFFFKSATLDYRAGDSFRMRIHVDHAPAQNSLFQSGTPLRSGLFRSFPDDDDQDEVTP